MKKRAYSIIITVIAACLAMGIVDAVIQPGYAVKSLVKILLFLLIPFVYSVFDKKCNLKALLKPDKKGITLALLAGFAVFGVVLGAYLLFKDVFDFSALTKSLTKTTGVNGQNFVWVAIYISFANSLLEEFFFRGFAFLTLKRVSTRKFAYVFSALCFALYHIAMMIGWFGIPVILISLIGLFVGGIIFNAFDEKYGNIYISWLIHMFANFATNAIGLILFSK
ncbi:MAG: CPBP family intramembrane metalloprotease [Ruminococcaceae bacterium]|nr:CPBP family intramembrane metalloprotease [Oscillospiraceae bacterium]